MGSNLSQKQKGYVGLGAMAVLAAATIWGSDPIYGAIDDFTRSLAPSIYTAGTYTGTAQGFGGEITATVTVTDKVIETVELTGADETPGIGSNALEQLPDMIIGKQSAEVDAVAGATVSSNAIKEAVSKALAQARGEAESSQEETKEVQKATDGTFIPGTYTAKSKGMAEMEVEVVVTKDAIESVKILSHGETDGIADPALKNIPEAIVAAQGLGVDAVSGATVTSNAILKAVEDCLTQAGADIDALKAKGADTAKEAKTEAETEKEAFTGYVPGTYTAKSTGMGEMEVEVVVTADAIESVKILSHNETEGISDPALEKIPAAIVEKQSADVDAVSGATVTSDAIMKAVKDCLAQAKADGTQPSEEESAGSGYTAGTYTAKSTGMGEMEVEVVVTADAIESVKILSHNETEGISDPALEKIPAAIVEKQSADVDAVSGATVTSDAIMKAVKDCLVQAGAGTTSKETEKAETAGYTAGTYTAKSTGMGEMEVEVVVSADAIESVKILSHNETEGISDPALEKIPAAIVEKQSADVDAVSGATVTSDAIMKAVKDCLAQAGA